MRLAGRQFETGRPVKSLEADKDYLLGNKEDLMKFFRHETGKDDPKVCRAWKKSCFHCLVPFHALIQFC